MSDLDKYPNKSSAEEHEFFGRLDIPFEKSKEEVWDQMFGQLEDKQPETKKIFVRSRTFTIAMAAAVLVLAGLFSLMRFYTSSIYNPAGGLLAIELPDGSTVDLNAASSIEYNPYWYWVNRKISLNGEAFFEVEKGQEFSVVSNHGKTVVLGTSFNIFARGEVYHVNCLTGKVMVVSETKKEAILGPGYQAEVEKNGAIKVFKNEDQSQTYDWRNGMFTFTSSPLAQVISEIERQYEVKIQLETQSAYYYTGYFTREKSVDEVLELVCRTFGLQFEKKTEGTYVVSEYRD